MEALWKICSQKTSQSSAIPSTRRNELIDLLGLKTKISCNVIPSTPHTIVLHMACSLPLGGGMERICQHCGESIVGNAYRVMSEDQGITLLDMVVCSLCFMEAKRLRLHTEEINLRGKQTSVRNRRSHSSRLEV